MRPGTCLCLLAASALAAPGEAAARDFAVSSFDGTRIQAHFFPAPTLLPGTPAPTVLVGPGWGNGGGTNASEPSSDADGRIGIGALRRTGYNVMTWDPRGFGTSGGEAKVDSPHYEARDVQKLLDALALLPEAMLDGPGDPRVGMAGASYGGGIQWVTAAIDSRIDAIAPSISWHSLVTSLYKDEAFKAGWAGYLCGTGAGQGVSRGLINPEGVDAGSMDAHMYSVCRTGLASGRLLERDHDWLADRGPLRTWMARVRTPALILHGTGDTLFTLDEAIANFRVLRDNGVPVRMMWFCGGHGGCVTRKGLSRYLESAVLRWFARYLRGDELVYLGPRFEWIDQYGAWHPASDYPLGPDGSLTAGGSGTLQLVAGDTASSGTALTATPSLSAVDIPIPPPQRRANLVGSPELVLEYRGTGTADFTHAFAQLVDRDDETVVGGQATPLPLKLDGRPHTLKLPLEAVARIVWPSTDLALQVAPVTNVYGQQRVTGTVELTRVSLTLPLGRQPTEAGPQPRCTPSFAPRAVRLGKKGKARFTPRVSCGGTLLDLRVRISGGKRRWKGRTGRRAVIPVRARTRRLVARFSHDGERARQRIRIKRRRPRGG